MAIVKKGTVTVATSGAAQNLNLGFFPSYFRMMNLTEISSVSVDGIIVAEWYSGMTDGTAITQTATAGAPVYDLLATNGFTPFQTADSNLFVPNQAPYTTTSGDREYIGASTLQVIAKASGISKATQALVTVTDAHSFTTAADVGVTVVTFHGVPGMKEINGLSGVITSVPTTTTFTVNIDTSNFTAYSSTGITDGLNSGFYNVITGAPASTLYSNTYLPTAEANLGQIGLTLGLTLMFNADDVWEYVAYLDAPITS